MRMVRPPANSQVPVTVGPGGFIRRGVPTSTPSIRPVYNPPPRPIYSVPGTSSSSSSSSSCFPPPFGGHTCINSEGNQTNLHITICMDTQCQKCMHTYNILLPNLMHYREMSRHLPDPRLRIRFVDELAVMDLQSPPDLSYSSYATSPSANIPVSMNNNVSGSSGDSRPSSVSSGITNIGDSSQLYNDSTFFEPYLCSQPSVSASRAP